jgi:hypothetical protein
MTLRDPDDASLPRSGSEVSTLGRMTKAFPDDRSSYDVVVTAPAPAERADAVERRLRQFGTQLATDATFTGASTEVGVPTRQAVAGGITDSAGTVTSAAIIMVSVFAVFVLGHGIEFKQLGVGMATAVLIDALIVRAFVLPALLTLLDEKVWWPSRPTGAGAAR